MEQKANQLVEAIDQVVDIPTSMNQESLYGMSEIEMMQLSQERYTAWMRAKLDEICGR